MPTTSPSIVTSGPPELPGLAAASNWIRLVSICCPSGERNWRFRPETTPADADGPMPNGKPTATTWSPGREVGGRAHRRRLEVVGDRLGAQDGEVVLGLRAQHDRVGLGAVEEGDPDLLGAADDVQVGEDGAVVDDHDAGADAALDGAVLLAVAAVVAVGHQADDAHDRRDDRVVGARFRRDERLVLDRLADGGVDLLDRQRRLGAEASGSTTRRRRRGSSKSSAQRRRSWRASARPAAGCARPPGAGSRRRRRSRCGLGRRLGRAARTAVQRDSFHRVHPGEAVEGRAGDDEQVARRSLREAFVDYGSTPAMTCHSARRGAQASCAACGSTPIATSTPPSSTPIATRSSRGHAPPAVAQIVIPAVDAGNFEHGARARAPAPARLRARHPSDVHRARPATTTWRRCATALAPPRRRSAPGRGRRDRPRPLRRRPRPSSGRRRSSRRSSRSPASSSCRSSCTSVARSTGAHAVAPAPRAGRHRACLQRQRAAGRRLRRARLPARLRRRRDVRARAAHPRVGRAVAADGDRDGDRLARHPAAVALPTAEARAAGATMRNEPAELARIGAELAALRGEPAEAARRGDDGQRDRVAAASRRPARRRRPWLKARAADLPEVHDLGVGRRALPAPRHAVGAGRDAHRRSARDRARVRAAHDGVDAGARGDRVRRRARRPARPRRRRDHALLQQAAADAMHRGRAQPARHRRLSPVVPAAAADRPASRSSRWTRSASSTTRARAARSTRCASISTTTRRPARCSTAPRSIATARRCSPTAA